MHIIFQVYVKESNFLYIFLINFLFKCQKIQPSQGNTCEESCCSSDLCNSQCISIDKGDYQFKQHSKLIGTHTMVTEMVTVLIL